MSKRDHTRHHPTEVQVQIETETYYDQQASPPQIE
jgi:hypothetical protein